MLTSAVKWHWYDMIWNNTNSCQFWCLQLVMWSCSYIEFSCRICCSIQYCFSEIHEMMLKKMTRSFLSAFSCVIFVIEMTFWNNIMSPYCFQRIVTVANSCVQKYYNFLVRFEDDIIFKILFNFNALGSNCDLELSRFQVENEKRTYATCGECFVFHIQYWTEFKTFWNVAWHNILWTFKNVPLW